MDDENIVDEINNEKPVNGRKHRGKKGLRIIALLLVCIMVSGITGTSASLLTLKFFGFFDETAIVDETEDWEYSNSTEESTTEEPTTEAPETTTEEITTEETTEAPTTQPPTTVPPTTQPPTTQPQATKSQIYATAVHSVVGVSASYTKKILTLLGTVERNYLSTGTGFYVSNNGYIVTNYHVVENAEKIVVSDYDGNRVSATFIARMKDNDIALLKIDQSTPKLYLGSSSSMHVGDDCMIIGNPMGTLSYTYTDGMISYINRTITTDSGYTINMFQTNAAINSGNSGGPVFNSDGEVIGVATAKYSTSEGLSFFIPVDDIRSFIYQNIS